MITKNNAKLSVGPGWGKLINILYFFKPRHVIVTQLKEKWGYLHFYVGSAPMWYFNLIDWAEKKSMTICEVCGKKGRIYADGWHVCRCSKHHLK